MQRFRGTRIPEHKSVISYMDEAARYGTVSMLKYLYCQLPHDLNQAYDGAMEAAAAKGDLDMVRTLQSIIMA